MNLTVWIRAHELRVGDWIEGSGIVKTIRNYNGHVFVTYEDRNLYSIFGLREQVEVRLEDKGEAA